MIRSKHSARQSRSPYIDGAYHDELVEDAARQSCAVGWIAALI